jgi:hypothetical protein
VEVGTAMYMRRGVIGPPTGLLDRVGHMHLEWESRSMNARESPRIESCTDWSLGLSLCELIDGSVV